MPKYQNAIMKQLRESTSVLEPYFIDTVYFGGGTPSYFGAERLVKILGVLKKHTNLLIKSEVTLEVNPDSITLQDLKLLKKEGFNRLSIGMQSASDAILKSLGRRHDFSQVVMAVKNGREAGFDNISLDLIYGLPSETREDWVESLNKAMSLRPQHISCYGLKIEEGTPLYQYRDYPGIPDSDTQADMYLYAVEALERSGYKQYEISNFSLPGYESRHNLKYWNQQEYMGFGPAAHSYVGDKRYGYIRDLNQYIDRIEHGGDLVTEVEDISPLDKASEYIMLGMRLNKGISEREYLSIYRSNFSPLEELLRDYEKHGWTKLTDDRWSFTPQGFLISNPLIGELMDAQAEQKNAIGAQLQVNELAKESEDGKQMSMADF